MSSLPTLHFGAKPPFSFEKFLDICRSLISESDLDVVKSAKEIGEASEDLQPTLKKWRIFDTMLRNELVKIRADRKHINPAPYLRGDASAEPYIRNAAMNAYKSPSLLESERILDRERWRVLDELSLGHYFDLDLLIIYALKLLISEKWDRIQNADRKRMLEEAVWH